MTDLEIARALELCERATPGPWKWNKHDQLFSDPNADIVLFIEREGDVYGPTADLSVSGEDREFIAAARTLLPSALAALVAEREETRRLRRIIERQDYWLREVSVVACLHGALYVPDNLCVEGHRIAEEVRALVTPPAERESRGGAGGE